MWVSLSSQTWASIVSLMGYMPFVKMGFVRRYDNQESYRAIFAFLQRVTMGSFKIVIAYIKLGVPRALEWFPMASRSNPRLARGHYNRNSHSGHQSLHDRSGNGHAKPTGQGSA